MTKYWVLATLLSLYTIALMTSMAGMEILSWSIFAASLFCYSRFGEIKKNRHHFIFPVSLLVWSICTAIYQGLPFETIRWGVGDYRWIILMLAFSFSIVLLFEQERFWLAFKKWLTPTLLVVLGIVSLYAITQHFTGYDLVRGAKKVMVPAVGSGDSVTRWRSAGFFSMPLTYGYSMGMMLCFLIPLVLVIERVWLRWLAVFVGVLSFVSVLTTFTRGAWIALAGTFLVMLLSLLNWRRALALGLGGLILGLSFYFLSPSFKVRMDSITDLSNRSNSERVVIWKSFLLMARDYPITGVGYNVDGHKLDTYLAELNETVEFPGHAHNNFLQFLGVTGLVGLVLYLAMCIWFLRYSWHLIQWGGDSRYSVLSLLGVSLLSAQLFFHIGGLTECNFFDAEVRHVLMFTWSLVIAFNTPKLQTMLARMDQKTTL
jgi:hypothetical protein